MSEERKERCENCRFWEYVDLLDGEPPEGLASGICRRFPPYSTDPDDNKFAQWIETVSDDWCGEFQTKGSQQVQASTKTDDWPQFIAELKKRSIVAAHAITKNGICSFDELLESPLKFKLVTKREKRILTGMLAERGLKLKGD